jgi:hypothetical protein
MTWLEAQSVGEGFNIAGSRPQINNNPLDLIWGTEAEAFGATHGDRMNIESYKGYSGFAVFPNVPTGFRAAQRWLSVPAKFTSTPIPNRPEGPQGWLASGYLGATLEQVCYRFAPPEDGNDTEAYITGNCQRSGYQRTDVLTEAMLQTPEAD